MGDSFLLLIAGAMILMTVRFCWTAIMFYQRWRHDRSIETDRAPQDHAADLSRH